MTIAIVWGDPTDTTKDSGFLYFDATTAYTKNYKGSVTKHPIDGGGLITDHFIKDNPTFGVSGVFTGADINTWAFLVGNLEGQTAFNTSAAPSAVTVTSVNGLIPFLPDTIGQFFGVSTPNVTMDTSRNDYTEQVQDLLVNLMQGRVYDETTQTYKSNIQLVKIYEYEGLILKRIIDNLVITGINFKEDSNTGLALYADLQFEQVTFVTQKKTAIPKDVAAKLKSKSASKNSKGKQDSTPQGAGADGAPANDIDPLRHD